MKYAFVNLALFFVALIWLPNSFGAGFECAKAGTRIERLICSDEHLSSLDSELGSVYRQALGRSETRPAAVKSQRDWIKKVRDACPDAACLRQAYESRLAALKGRQEKTPTQRRAPANQDDSIPPSRDSPPAPPLTESVTGPENATGEKPIHPLIFSLMKAWVSDTEEPVVTEISIDSMERNGNQFSYDSVAVTEGIVEYREDHDGVDERKYYKVLTKEGNDFMVDYFENSGGSLTEHVRLKCRINTKTIGIDGANRNVRVLQLISIDRKD